MSVACGKKSGETDCAADANCVYGSGYCQMSNSKEKELRRGMMQVLKDKCGNLVNFIHNDRCILQDTVASCKNEQNCDWEMNSAGTEHREPNEAGTKCVITEFKGQCITEKDANNEDAMTKLCPDVESAEQLQKECATKPLTEKVSCATEKCPIVALFMGAMLCGKVTTQDACTTLGNTCKWDDGKCSINVAPVFDKMIPEGCPLRSTLEQQTGQFLRDPIKIKGMKCMEASTEEKCNDAGEMCQWRTFKSCSHRTDEVLTKSVCGYNAGVLAGEEIAKMLLPVDVQLVKCSKSKTQISCELTPKGPVRPDSVRAVSMGTSVSMGDAFTIGVIVSLMIYW